MFLGWYVIRVFGIKSQSFTNRLIYNRFDQVLGLEDTIIFFELKYSNTKREMSDVIKGVT